MVRNDILKGCFAAFLLLFWMRPAFSQTPAPTAGNHGQKINEIKELLELSNAEQTQIQVMDLMVERFKADMPKVPASFWDKFSSKMKEQLPLIDAKVAEIYDKHFSQEDIEGIIQFYKTQAGRHFVAELPGMMQEMMPVAMEWGKQVATQAVEELQKAGYHYQPHDI